MTGLTGRYGPSAREISDYFNWLPSLPPLTSRCLEVVLANNLPADQLPISLRSLVATLREVPGVYRRKAVMTTEAGEPGDDGSEDGWVSRPPLLLSVTRDAGGKWDIAQVKEVFHFQREISTYRSGSCCLYGGLGEITTKQNR